MSNSLENPNKSETTNLINRIKNLPNSKILLNMVREEDLPLIARYDKQIDELLAKGIPATLMTNEEKLSSTHFVRHGCCD